MKRLRCGGLFNKHLTMSMIDCSTGLGCPSHMGS